MAELKVFSIISSINSMLREGRGVPLSGLVMVNKQRMEELLEELEANLDPDLDRAEKLLSRERELLQRIDDQRIETESKAASEARAMVDEANKAAQKTRADAEAEAAEKVRRAAEQANQMLVNAQNQANRMLAEAQNTAAQMVAQDTITLTAKKYAEDIRNAAQADCDRLNDETLGNLHRMLEHADISLATQLDSLRTLRQQLGMTYTEENMEGYDDAGYPEDGYSE